jgi:hypothetical protein
MATVLTGNAIRARTGYGLFVPRGATATGPHGVYPGTGHVAKLDRITHPAAVQSVRSVQGRGPIPAGARRPVRRGPVSRPHVRPPTVGGTVVEVGGFINQENAGGTTSGIGGGSAARAATGGYFAGLLDQGGIGGLSWLQLAEGAAVIFAAALLWHATGRKGRR